MIVIIPMLFRWCSCVASMLFLFRSSVVLVLCYCCVGVVPMMLLDVIVVPRLFLWCSNDVVVLFLCG